jgi:UDP-2-acetamido-3-amino-2,3-dideoxy-glucuronate N-acetyltransferase
VSKLSVPATSVVDETAVIGEGTRVWNFVHVREKAKIGKDCILGDYVYVGRGVKIGNNVKIQNRATVYEGVTIEDKVFVGPHVTFTNDLYPRSFNTDWKITPTHVKEGASIGARTVIVCGVTIGEYALIGAGSVVTTDIPAHALAYGNPARIRGFVCRCSRKLEVIEKNGNDIVMKCSSCDETYTIATEDYSRFKNGK